MTTEMQHTVCIKGCKSHKEMHDKLRTAIVLVYECNNPDSVATELEFRCYGGDTINTYAEFINKKTKEKVSYGILHKEWHEYFKGTPLKITHDKFQ